MSKKLIRNTLFNVSGYAWSVLVALVLIPYIISRIGIDRYGIWALVGVLTGYFGLFDLGTGTSFVKYLAEFHTKKDYAKMNQVINTGLVFYSLIALPITLLGFLFIGPLLNLFNIPPGLHGEARFVFLLGIILFGVFNTLRTVSALQTGLQRMDITNKMLIALSVPQVIGTVLCLELGYGLSGLMVNHALILAITGVVNVIVAFKIFPHLKLNPFLSNKEMFKQLFGFGYKIQLTTIAGWLQGQMDKILLAYFLSVGSVTYYTVAANLVARIRGLPLLVVSAVLPAASELGAKSDQESLKILYFRSMKYVAMTVLPITALVMLLAVPFIKLWLGEGFERSVLTLQILVFGYLFNILTGPGAYILNGTGRPQYAMWGALVAIPINLTLSITLVMRIGFFGVVIGTTTSLIVSAIYFIFMSHHVMNMYILSMFAKILFKPFVACAIPFLPGYFLIQQINEMGWGVMTAMASLYLIVFGLIIWLLNYLDDFDKALINRYLSRRLL